jgi:maleate cis-trans isomerase
MRNLNRQESNMSPLFRIDVLGNACLVPIMSMGHGYHRICEARLKAHTEDNIAPSLNTGTP